jgi:MoaA/NifB/PqqE/SkfB family radical SAM enzyme
MNLRKKILLNLYDQHYSLLKNVHSLRSVSVEITNHCNLQCRHCYMDSVAVHEEGELTGEEWINFFKQLRNQFGKKIGIGITGGEPFIRQDIFNILEKIKELGFTFSIATNGLLLDKEKIYLLEKLTQSVSISLDGFQESHEHLRGRNTYEKLMEVIDIIANRKLINLTIKTAVYKDNIDNLDEFHQFIKEKGIKIWHLFPFEPNGRGRVNKQDILSQSQYLGLCRYIDSLRKKEKEIEIFFDEQTNYLLAEKVEDLASCKRCSAGITNFAVLYNGDIVSCIQYDRSKINEYGNVKNSDIKKIWESSFLENRCPGYRSCDNHNFIK